MRHKQITFSGFFATFLPSILNLEINDIYQTFIFLGNVFKMLEATQCTAFIFCCHFDTNRKSSSYRPSSLHVIAHISGCLCIALELLIWETSWCLSLFFSAWILELSVHSCYILVRLLFFLSLSISASHFNLTT